jgi:hypothetical protein
MGRKGSIARLVLCFAIALAMLVGTPAGSVTAGLAGTACSGCPGGDETPSAKHQCPKSDPNCITSARCAMSCAGETLFRTAALSATVHPAEEPFLCARTSAMASHTLKPDLHPPRSHV